MYHEQRARNAEVLALILGAGVFFSPYMFGFAYGSMLLNSLIAGFIVFVIAAIRALVPNRAAWLSWLNLLVGLWLLISPFILSYSSPVATWGAVIVGLIIAGAEYYS